MLLFTLDKEKICLTETVQHSAFINDDASGLLYTVLLVEYTHR